MPHSGDSIETIVIGGIERPFKHGETYRAPDSECIYFQLPAGCQPASDRKIYPAKDFPLKGNFWFWHPNGKNQKIALERRCGLHTLTLFRPRHIQLKVVVYSEKILTNDEYNRMIYEIESVFPAASWDQLRRHHSRAGTAGSGLPRPGSSLIELVREELAVARRIERNVPWELSPRHPSQPPVPGSPSHQANYDVQENRVVVGWARLRRAELLARRPVINDTAKNLENHVEEVTQTAGPTRINKWREKHKEHIEYLRGLIAECNVLVATLTQVERRFLARGIRPTWKMSPSIRRKPDPFRLACAQSYTTLYSPSLLGTISPVLPLRPTSFLYEIWAGIEIVRSIQKMGFELAGPPTVHASSAVNPESPLSGLPLRASWTLLRKNTCIEFELGPTPRPCLPDQVSGLRLPSRERAAAHLAGRNPGLFIAGDLMTPDYAIKVTTPYGVAVCVGDARYSDPEHKRSSGALREKLQKIASTYASRIGWLGHSGKVTMCVESTCFAVVPRKVSVELHPNSAASEVALLVLAPGENEHRQRSLIEIKKIVETLEWWAQNRAPRQVAEC